jgi:predicted nucleic acid-binding protein
VLSESTRSAPNPKVDAWLERNEFHLAVDPIILGEIRFGIILLPLGKRRRNLENWFANVISKVQCVAWDAAIGLRWAKLLADLRSSGSSMPVKDSLIAATALQHDLTLVTRNTKDFQVAGVKLFNPFV